jgi:uncharacterized protein
MRAMRACLVPVVAMLVGCGGASHPTSTPQPPVAPTAPAVPEPPSEQLGIPAGYVEAVIERVVELPGEGGAVLVVDEATNMIVPIFIGGTEAHSIELRLRGSAPQRPLTHDLLDTIVVKLKASIVKVQIDELRDQTFIGSVFVRGNGKIYRIDARPSDAIALAIGNKVPIYIAKKVLDEAGRPRDEINRMLGGSTSGTGGPTT